MSKMGTITRKKAMIDALSGTMGVIAPALKATGVSRSTHDDWFKFDLEYRKACEQTVEVQKDFVVSQAFQLVKEKNPQVVIHMLKTLCNDRGFGVKIDVDTTIRTAPTENIEAVIERMGGIENARDIMRGAIVNNG